MEHRKTAAYITEIQQTEPTASVTRGLVRLHCLHKGLHRLQTHNIAMFSSSFAQQDHIRKIMVLSSSAVRNIVISKRRSWRKVSHYSVSLIKNRYYILTFGCHCTNNPFSRPPCYFLNGKSDIFFFTFVSFVRYYEEQIEVLGRNTRVRGAFKGNIRIPIWARKDVLTLLADGMVCRVAAAPRTVQVYQQV